MRIHEADGLLKESSKILSYECPKSEYGHLMRAMQESEAQLQSYLQTVQMMQTTENAINRI